MTVIVKNNHSQTIIHVQPGLVEVTRHRQSQESAIKALEDALRVVKNARKIQHKTPAQRAAEALGFWCTGVMVDWNDAPERTYKDVRKLLRERAGLTK